MRITSFIKRQHVFTATSFKIKGSKVLCVASDGSNREFLLRDLVWYSDKNKNGCYRICHLVKDEVSGGQVKKVAESDREGFAVVTLPDKTKLNINKKLHKLYRTD